MRVTPACLHSSASLQGIALTTWSICKSHHQKPPTLSGVGLLKGHLSITSPSRSGHAGSGEEQGSMHSPAAPRPSPPARQSEQRCCCTQRRHQLLPPNLERVSAPLVAQHVRFNVSTPAAGRERRCPEPGQQAGGGLCEMHAAALCQQPRHVSLRRRHRHGTGLAGADRDGGAGSRRLWTSSFSVTGHCISSGHTPRAGFTFLSVVFKALLAATTNDA